MRIVGIYEKLIIFEDDKNKKSIVETCGEGKQLYTFFLRRRDVELSGFFKVDVLK